ncbi:hypothetical protein KC329_g96 [Hortaea werneckii]|nr:hypothetical protein KC329_g96 [Hortaea werneckii]
MFYQREASRLLRVPERESAELLMPGRGCLCGGIPSFSAKPPHTCMKLIMLASRHVGARQKRLDSYAMQYTAGACAPSYLTDALPSLSKRSSRERFSTAVVKDMVDMWSEV